MPTVKLTDRFVSGVQSTSRANYFDTKVKGLNLRVAPSGRKTWIFVYRTPGSTSPQWSPIGTFPAVSLADARRLALDQRKAVEVDGGDPVAERKAKRHTTPSPTVFTFGDLAKLYLTLAKATKKSWRDDKQKIDKYLLPAWGTRPLRTITRTDVHELLDNLVAEGMTTGVNRVQAVISRLFTIALDRSLVDAHPATRMIKRTKEQPRDRTLTDEEIRTLWIGLDAAPGPAADVIRLRLLLGQRGAEIAGMQWADVDVENATWTLPGTLTKNAHPHAVPLPRMALDIVTSQPSRDADDVFPGVSMQAKAYRDLAAIHGGQYQWKDCRRTMATRIAGLGFSETTIGRSLNHTAHTVTAKHYNQHRYLAEIRQALDAWDVEVDRILEKRKPRKKVLPFAGS